MATPTRLPEFGNLALPLVVVLPDLVRDADGSDVANINPLVEFDGGAEPALSRLFAAAPDLLLAAERVLAISDRDHDAWTALRAAIAKARGTEVAGG